ncbi:T9SS type A sorting domain-containing protein [Cyclobacterium qasimii]|nr:T9SS type A sorting domain-containing protein [Cyclobacterium qasimii]
MRQTYSVFSLIFLLFVLPMSLVNAQNGVPDNKGKEFWLMFNRNLDNRGINPDLFITGDIATTGRVNLPNDVQIDFSVVPGEITKIDLPISILAIEEEEISQKGIHIIAENEVTVYGLSQRTNSTDAFLGLPLDVLGNEYVVMSNGTLIINRTVSYSLLGIVAPWDNTEVTIIPSSDTRNRQKGVPFKINLQKGEIYQLSAAVSNGDLTGTIITSNNSIAVFSGHTCSYVGSGARTCDFIIEQIPPVLSLGQRFVTVPLATRKAGDIFRMVATKDGTNISIVGTNDFKESISLNRGEFREISIPSGVFSNIISNQAVLVAQFSKSQDVDNVTSDPFMVLIPPFEQFQNQYTVSTPSSGFSKHFINLSVPISQKDKIKLNESFLDSSLFTDIPGSAFAGAQVEVSAGTNNISGNLAFGAFIYGFGSNDSYGYPAGQALSSVEQVESISLDLEQEIEQGSTYCFNSTVTDDEGVPIFGVRVDFEIEGPNEKIGFAVTDEQGIANFCYDAVSEGTDKIIATVGSTTTEGTVITSIPRPVSVLLTSMPDVVNMGEEICLSSQVLDQFGNPIEGEELFIEYIGNVLYSGDSDENGKVDYCFTPEEGGDLQFSSYFDSINKTELMVEVSIPAAVPSTITVVSEGNEINLGQQICVTATVLDQFGEIMEGVEVQLEINGKHAGSEITDENGVAEFCKTAALEDGELLIFIVNYIGGGTPASTSIKVLNSGGGNGGGNGGGGDLVASSISISGLPVEVQLGEEACFQSIVLDQNGDPLPNTEVDIVVNGDLIATLITNEEGIVAYCLASETLGDLGFSVSYSGGVPVNGSVKVIQVEIIATTISVNPSEDEVSLGEETCLEVGVLDQFDNPVGDIEVFITKNGDSVGSMMTAEDGMMNYCFTPDMEGEFEYSFHYTSENENRINSIITVKDNTPIPTIITFVDNEVEVVVGEEICLAATILDQFGIPLVGVEVSFDVNGVFYGKGITDENGRVEFCEIPDEMGDLIVTATYEGGAPAEATIKVITETDVLEIESFWLVDANDFSLIRELMDGEKIPYSTLKGNRYNIAAITNEEKVGSVRFTYEYLFHCSTCSPHRGGRTENFVPYTALHEGIGPLAGKALYPGFYQFSATPYGKNSGKGNKGLESTLKFEVYFENIIEGFTLVNATDDADIIAIKDGDIVDLSAFKGKKFNIRANTPVNQVQGGVGMEISGTINLSKFEKFKPYALFMDTNGDYAGVDLPEGNYTLSATAFPFNSSTTRGVGGVTETINFEVIHNSKVDKFTLVNADTDRDIMTIIEGAYIDLNQYKDVKLNIRADGKGGHLAAMSFQLSGAKNYNWTERKAPYAIFGDLPANDYVGKYFKEGNYKLMVTPYNVDNTMGESLTINFSAGFDKGDNLRINGASMNQLEANTTEVGENEGRQQESLTVYPQPAQNFVNFNYPSSLREDATVMIYKGNGQLIHGAQMGNTPDFNFGRYGSGLYLIHVTDIDKVITKKIFIY